MGNIIYFNCYDETEEAIRQIMEEQCILINKKLDEKARLKKICKCGKKAWVGSL